VVVWRGFDSDPVGAGLASCSNIAQAVQRIILPGILANYPRGASQNLACASHFPIGLEASTESIDDMKGFSLHWALLGWVLIAALSFFVGVMILRMWRHASVLTRWTQRAGLHRSSRNGM
jgi:hypothetical protein